MTTLQTAIASLEALLKSSPDSQPSQMQRYDQVFALLQLLPSLDKAEIARLQPRLETCLFALIAQPCNKSLRGQVVELGTLLLKCGNVARVQEMSMEALRLAKDPKSVELTKVCISQLAPLQSCWLPSSNPTCRRSSLPARLTSWMWASELSRTTRKAGSKWRH